MSKEQEIAQYEAALKQAQLSQNAGALQQVQQQQTIQDAERGMIDEQLNVNEILDRVHNLLRGYIVKKDEETGQMYWAEPESEDQKILTEHGVNYFMGAMQWYLNKNTLLSNYNEDQINAKMYDLSITMIDDTFMEYDKIFLYPSIEDCQQEFNLRIENKLNNMRFRAELMGREFNYEIEKAVLLKDMEPRIEREIATIREQKIKNKLKRFESLMRFIQDTIHSAYQRAMNGQERTSLRKHMHVSETKGFNPMPQPQSSLNPFSVFGRKK